MDEMSCRDCKAGMTQAMNAEIGYRCIEHGTRGVAVRTIISTVARSAVEGCILLLTDAEYKDAAKWLRENLPPVFGDEIAEKMIENASNCKE